MLSLHSDHLLSSGVRDHFLNVLLFYYLNSIQQFQPSTKKCVTGAALKRHQPERTSEHTAGCENKSRKGDGHCLCLAPDTLQGEGQGLKPERKQGLVLTRANSPANWKRGLGSSERGSCLALPATGFLLNICSFFCKCCHLKLCYFNW